MSRKYPKPTIDKIRQSLTDNEFQVTQNDATEPPFDNRYWDNKSAGIYVDVVTGEPLFSSLDKYDSGTGWPSFSQPINENSVRQKTEVKLLHPRTEIRSVIADSHLGHVFDDGLNGGKRYCINSASLKFIPFDELVTSGYGEFKALFLTTN